MTARQIMVSAVLGAFAIGLVGNHMAIGADEGLQVGQRLPGFSARDLNGAQHSLKQYEGKILVLHFWATWCPFCRGEIAKLREVHEEFKAQGVRVLTVSVDEDLTYLRRFVAERDLPYAVIADIQAASSFAPRYGIRSVPTTILITRDGVIAARLIGTSDIVGTVDQALAASPAPST